MRSVLLAAISCALVAPAARAQQAKSRATEHLLAALPNSLFFVVPPRTPPAAGRKGPLLVVLPGGAGTRDFLPFVENGIAAQAPDDGTVVLVTAVKWKPDQQIVWPTEASKVPGMQYSTEAYVRAVVAEVVKSQPVDPERAVVLAWSSSGPGVYPLLVAADGPFARAYVAMSVWPGARLGDLAAVKGRRFVLDQSPEDTTTRFPEARAAFAALTEAGAIVRLSTYRGGHGWKDAPLPRLREGLRWLWSDEPAPAPQWPAEKQRASKPGKDGSLLANGDFEQGLDGWREIDNSGRLDAAVDKQRQHGGKQALHLGKTGGLPLDLVVQEIDDLPAKGKVTATAWLKSAGAKNAWIKVWLYGDGDQVLHEDVDLAHVTGDLDWQQFTKTWEVAGAKRAVVQIVMVLGGELWVDDVSLVPAK